MFASVAYMLYTIDCPHIPRTTHYFNKERTTTMKTTFSLTIINTRTELILLLLIIHYYSYHVLKLKRISILHLTLKDLLITLQLIIRLCMLHLLLIASCRLGLMLWMRIGVHKVCFYSSIYFNSLFLNESIVPSNIVTIA